MNNEDMFNKADMINKAEMFKKDIFNKAYMSNKLFPNCNDTYSNESDLSEVPFLQDITQFLEIINWNHISFFIGHCYACRQVPPLGESLKRCAGCQLVAYCDRECQKSIWPIHKPVCKEFPVVNGKNVLHSTTGSWKKHIVGLREHMIKNITNGVVRFNAYSIFRNPRVCHTCGNAHQEQLHDCKCLCISYCSKKCAKTDKSHKEHCYNLIQMSFVHTHGGFSVKKEMILDILRIETVFEKFVPLTYKWSDILPANALQFSFTTHGIDIVETLHKNVIYERLAYPMSLLYALQSLPKRRLGPNSPPLEDLTSLNIHVIHISPLFDSAPWEIFMHRLPKLKRLNVTYVIQAEVYKMVYKHSFAHNFTLNMSLQRCDDCKVKNRVITYSIQKNPYHMYFSSEEYTDPDVVVIFDNVFEMCVFKDGHTIHSEISYRNMIHSQDTVLVLMDQTEEYVTLGSSAVNEMQPVDQLVPIQENPLRGYGSRRADIESNTVVYNDKKYFTCLRSK